MSGFRNIFFNLSTRNKLFSGFVIIMVLVIVVEYNEHNSLTRLSKMHDDLQIADETRVAIKNAKLFIIEDAKVIQNVLYAKDNQGLENATYEHIRISNGFLAEIQKIENMGQLAKDKGIRNPVDARNLNAIRNISDTYEQLVNTSYEQLRQLKQEMFALATESSSINSTQLVTDSIQQMRRVMAVRQEARKQKIKEGLDEHYEKIEIYAEGIKRSLEKELESDIQSDIKIIQQRAIEIRRKVELTSIFLILGGGLLSFLIAFGLSYIVAKQLGNIQSILSKMSNGELPDYKPLDTYDEVGAISQSLHRLIKALRDTSAFAKAIGQADFSTHYKPLSAEDQLGNSLLEMRKSLQVAAEEEERRHLEDSRRNWTTEGLAKFSDILRQSSENIEVLITNVISELVKYISANQAGVFVLNDKDPNNPTLDLLASYAYNRKKFIQKSIKIGQGLLGATAVEKYTVHLTEIPQDYMEIESALGGSNPDSLVIVPLKLEETIYGVMEIASFKKYEQYEIDFVERVAENIASTLSTIKINSKTAELLEQSRVQANEMHEKEEVLRQEIASHLSRIRENEKQIDTLNLRVEELNLQKLEADKREEKRLEFIREQERNFQGQLREMDVELKRFRDMLNLGSEGVIMLNENAQIEFINESVERILNYDTSELIGTTLEHFVEKNFFNQIERAIVRRDHKVLKELIGHDFRVNIFKKDGVSEEVRMSLQPISASGTVYYVLLLTELLELKAKEVKQTKVIERMMANEFKYKMEIEALQKLLAENEIAIPDTSDDDWLIQWGADYQLGLEVIDEQHKTWISIINKFYKAFKEGEANSHLNDIIKELIDYTDYHFGFEERYFTELKFHKGQEHTASHRKFVNRVLQLQSEFRAGKLDAAYELMNFLKPWVAEHIQIEDRQYIKLFKDHHVRYSMF